MEVVFPWVQEPLTLYLWKVVFFWAVAKMQFGSYEKFLLASTFGEDREFFNFIFYFYFLI